ncbi:TrkA C-terminal domain-containing protein [Euzebya sp.]|uniref:TrkA C-terminal domain-containing protein n=1 Tax=Euzebya sp. TaxID=1971409 RepID=UPI00351856E1
MLAIGTLLVVLLVSLLVTRVASVALVLTGLAPDVARFQARSAFSSTGLGTAEAEQIVSHPIRRRIISTLMLLGNVGLVTTVATLSVSFGSVERDAEALQRFGLLIGGLAVLALLARSEAVSRWMMRVSERLLRRYTELDVRDYHGLLHLAMDYAIDRILVVDDHWLAGRTLASSRLTEEGLLVLGVERADGVYLGAPTGATSIQPGDTVLVYGTASCLAELRDRRAGAEGTEAHLDNVAANEARVAAEQTMDRAGRWRRRRS